ncbi:hypothetical protein NM688_g8653 [Phlebia brevispora]|uniref:Uncharacterized protein n=1 Tax=Phlebia brevispora TaxID=194682 RepID=A0ACC1RST8_9APHY|nr:hypothetical protein NM688_g8653 [Phlebia brevispora]
MTEETAYRTLEVPKDVDETMLMTILNLRVEDQPLQADKMREALTVIAETRDSQRLRDFLSTGRDTADMTPENTPDMPRGLNQLGNTCYLNSLLQYFYTIKDLRGTILELPRSGGKFLDDKFTDDDLRRHRVGGRLVTRREVQRSKRFVNQLSELFWNLEYCESVAVTPTKELAKLALITSQDEEEDDQGSAGTDTSNDTDATLVDDGPVRSVTFERTAQSPIEEASPASVLGKRGRELPHTQSMDVDGETTDVDKDGYVVVSKPPSPGGSSPENVASSSKQKTVAQDTQDVEMRDETQKAPAEAKPPPLPPRRPKEVNESVMMFGRQHDVSECMDNCMFQIETALLDFQQDEEMENAESDKTSIVKRLFYGKKRQRLTPLTLTPDKRQRTLSTHEKEDLFSHLHINVSDESFDLYDGLGRYFDDVVELNGVKKRMEVTIVDLPPLLQIQLQRVQFDRETQQAYKSQAYVKFGETLFMDRFLDSADPDKKARSKEIQSRLNTVRDRIQRLTQGKYAPFGPSLGGVASFLSKHKVSEGAADGEDLVSRLNAEQSLVMSELERLRAEAVRLKQEQESIWEHETEATYDLTAVFIHRGSSPSFGHYFLYARNLPGKPDQWFKYNDSSVTIVSKDEVLADTTGSTANPYMLVYSRRDSEVIDTVRRFDPSSLQED